MKISNTDRLRQFDFERQQDRFYKDAKKLGYHCRSAFKLQQLDARFKLFTDPKITSVVDLGCAPGSWCQVIRERAPDGCTIVGVDLNNPQGVVPGAIYIKGDFTEAETQAKMMAAFGTDSKNSNHHLDVVVSDMAPKRTSVVGFGHQQKAAKLNSAALSFALRFLRPNGHFVCKVFGDKTAYYDLDKTAKENFSLVSYFKPDASRTESSEKFLICQKRLALPKRLDHGGNERFGLDDWPGSLATERYSLSKAARNNARSWRRSSSR